MADGASGGRGAVGVAGVGLSLSYAVERLADLGPALDRFELLGLDSVEIFLPSLGVVAGAQVRAGALAVLRAACADRPFGLTVHGPLGGNFGLPEHNALQQAVCAASLEVAAEIGAGVLVHHAAVIRPQCADALARARDAEIAALRAMAPVAAGCGVTLAVETMCARGEEWTALPHELAATLAAVDHPAVAATLDFSHARLNAAARGADFIASVAALAPFVRHMHVHDSFGRAADFRAWSRGDAVMFGFGDLHLPPGAGSTPWSALAALRWPGPAIANLELDPRWEHEWPEAIAWTRAWAAQATAPAAPPPRGAVR